MDRIKDFTTPTPNQYRTQPQLDVVGEIERILKIEAEAILAYTKRLKDKTTQMDMCRVLEIFQNSLESGGKIVVTAVGKSGKVAQKIAATLSSTGNLAIYLHPTEGLHGDLGVVSSKDTVFAISYSGNTEELVRLLPSIKAQNVPIIGMGGNPDSRLAEFCSVWIDGSVDQEACPHNLAPTTSTTLALAIGDALSMTLMQRRGFDIETFAKLHPGGSIGKRLTLRVSDLMKKGKQVGTASLTTNAEDVVAELTEKKLGGLLVVDGTTLLGLITEGDIRRALKHREKFFEMQAKDIMTPNPVRVTPHMMASDALRMMEERESQISVLPVVDESENWVGLLRLHDLAQNL